MAAFCFFFFGGGVISTFRILPPKKETKSGSKEPQNRQNLGYARGLINGRYHAPEEVFSCQAYDFGEGKYISQDVLLDQAACVAFYNAIADFKKAEIILIPGLEKKTSEEKDLKRAFECFGIGILKTVDNAQGIEILQEEMLEGGMFFATISVQKTSVLEFPNGQRVPATRGYLVFQDKDKLALLSNQLVTLPGQKHEPKKNVERLKREILEFRKTFEFGAIPESVIKKIKTEATSTS